MEIGVPNITLCNSLDPSISDSITNVSKNRKMRFVIKSNATDFDTHDTSISPVNCAGLDISIIRKDLIMLECAGFCGDDTLLINTEYGSIDIIWWGDQCMYPQYTSGYQGSKHLVAHFTTQTMTKKQRELKAARRVLAEREKIRRQAKDARLKCKRRIHINLDDTDNSDQSEDVSDESDESNELTEEYREIERLQSEISILETNMTVKWPINKALEPSSFAPPLLSLFVNDFGWCVRSTMAAAIIVRFEFALRVERAFELISFMLKFSPSIRNILDFDGNNKSAVDCFIHKICLQPLMNRQSDQTNNSKSPNAINNSTNGGGTATPNRYRTKIPSSMSNPTAAETSWRLCVASRVRRLLTDPLLRPTQLPSPQVVWALIDTLASLFRPRQATPPSLTNLSSFVDEVRSVKNSIMQDIKRESINHIPILSAIQFERIHHHTFKQIFKLKRSENVASLTALSVAKEARSATASHLKPPSPEMIEASATAQAAHIVRMHARLVKNKDKDSFVPHPCTNLIKLATEFADQATNAPANWRPRRKMPIMISKPNQNAVMQHVTENLMDWETLIGVYLLLLSPPEGSPSLRLRHKPKAYNIPHEILTDSDIESISDDEAKIESKLERVRDQEALRLIERQAKYNLLLQEREKEQACMKLIFKLKGLLAELTRQIQLTVDNRTSLIEEAITMAFSNRVQLPVGERFESLLKKLQETRRKREYKKRLRLDTGDATPPASDNEGEGGYDGGASKQEVLRTEIAKLRTQLREWLGKNPAVTEDHFTADVIIKSDSDQTMASTHQNNAIEYIKMETVSEIQARVVTALKAEKNRRKQNSAAVAMELPSLALTKPVILLHGSALKSDSSKNDDNHENENKMRSSELTCTIEDNGEEIVKMKSRKRRKIVVTEGDEHTLNCKTPIDIEVESSTIKAPNPIIDNIEEVKFELITAETISEEENCHSLTQIDTNLCDESNNQTDLNNDGSNLKSSFNVSVEIIPSTQTPSQKHNSIDTSNIKMESHNQVLTNNAAATKEQLLNLQASPSFDAKVESKIISSITESKNDAIPIILTDNKNQNQSRSHGTNSMLRTNNNYRSYTHQHQQNSSYPEPYNKSLNRSIGSESEKDKCTQRHYNHYNCKNNNSETNDAGCVIEMNRSAYKRNNDQYNNKQYNRNQTINQSSQPNNKLQENNYNYSLSLTKKDNHNNNTPNTTTAGSYKDDFYRNRDSNSKSQKQNQNTFNNNNQTRDNIHSATDKYYQQRQRYEGHKYNNNNNTYNNNSNTSRSYHEVSNKLLPKNATINKT